MNQRTFFSIFLIFFGFTAILHAQTPATAQTASVLTLNEAMQTLGSAELRWDPFFNTGVFSLGGHNAAFLASAKGESGPVLFNNRDVVNLPLPYAEKGELLFPDTFITGLTRNFERLLEEEQSRFRIAAIVIDPGHGGRDSGAIGNHIIDGVLFQSIEKNIVLKVAKLLYARLTDAFPDKRILLTRDGDSFPSLEDRVILANSIPLKENEAIIYISIHANASYSNPKASGYEIWYLPPDHQRVLLNKTGYSGSQDVWTILNDLMQYEYITESILLANKILEQFDNIFGGVMPSRGLKEEAWFVVRNAHMPSVLVELGFVSNLSDALLMADDNYLKKFSDVLYNGITEFIFLFERSGGFTAQY